MSDACHYTFALKLTLQAPFLIAGSIPTSYGVDVAQIRDLSGNPIIPDTHIKGVLRHAWAMFEAEAISLSHTADKMFGLTRDTPGGGTDELQYGDAQGIISFTDLVAQQPPTRNAVTRVAIEDATGTAAEGMLVTVEQVAGAGKSVEFAGCFTAHCGSLAKAEALKRDVEMALGAVEAIGRFKTVGFGRITGVEVGPPQPRASVALPSGFSDAAGFALTFRLNKRLLVDIKRLDSNTLVGAEIIPGAVLKGALALSLTQSEKLGGCGGALSRMVMSQAVPFASSIQLSVADGMNEIQIDEKLPVIDGKLAGIWPPTAQLDFGKSSAIAAFQPDWKGPKPGPTKPTLQRDVRTRVRIDAGTGAAKDGALFTQSAIAQTAKLEEAVIPVEWRATVRWPGKPGDDDHGQFIDCITALTQGLYSIGKTNAQTVDLRLTVAPLKQTAGFVVTLNSPTMMIRERHLANEELYAKALDAYWHKVSDGCLSIALADDSPVYETQDVGPPPLDFYCHQEFRSGYAALRFAYFGATRLEPFVLSKPGSVFVLKAKDPSKAAECLTKFLKTGLPVAKWDDQADLGSVDLDPEPNFAECPFGPQNGYGAFSIKEVIQ